MAVLLPGYTIEKEIKKGGFSVVYKGKRLRDNRDVALKVLTEQGYADREVRSSFRREAKILIDLDCEHIVKAHEYISDSERPAICMDFFAGTNLKTLLYKQSPLVKRHLPVIFLRSSQGLGYLHARGYIHRDVKPENLLVSEEGEVALIDFSLAMKIGLLYRFFGGSSRIQGTPLYMAPEQIRRKKLDFRTDIYSLGATFFEAVTGKPPFVGATTEEILTKHLKEKPSAPARYDNRMPDEINLLILNMLAKSPDRRPQSMDEVIEVLADYGN